MGKVDFFSGITSLRSVIPRGALQGGAQSLGAFHARFGDYLAALGDPEGGGLQGDGQSHTTLRVAWLFLYPHPRSSKLGSAEDTKKAATFSGSGFARRLAERGGFEPPVQ